MKGETFLLFVVVIGLIILFTILLKKMSYTEGIKCRYDERQKLVKGRGFQYAFYTMLMYYLLYGWSEVIFEVKFMDTATGSMTGILIGIMVLCVYCIWNDGYFGLNTNPKRLTVIFSIVGIINLVVSFFSIYHNMMIENEILTFHVLNLFCTILCVIVLLTMFIKKVYKRQEAE